MGARKKNIITDNNQIIYDKEEIIHSQATQKFLEENKDWILFEKEAEIIPFMKGMGKCDLIFMCTTSSKFHIIECKRHSPEKTLEQAEYYASWIKLRFPNYKVTYQSLICDNYSIIYDLDLQKAIFNTLSKIHTLCGLNRNELTTLAQLYTNLYTHKNSFTIF